MVLAAHFKPTYTTRDYIYEKTNYVIIVYNIYFNSASKQDTLRYQQVQSKMSLNEGGFGVLACSANYNLKSIVFKNILMRI